VPLIGAAAVRRALSALLLAVAGCSGCEADTLEIPWTYRFRDPALRATTVALTARVLRGGCGDEYPLQYREVFGLGETPPLPPRIGPGRWGFEVVATNAECAIVASGCTSTELPPDGDATRILVTVDVGSGAPACSADECIDGSCSPVEDMDAGPPPFDAGPDATRADGGNECGTCEPPNATGQCVGTACLVSRCDPHFADCNTVPADGCESACPDVPNVSPACYGERCVTASCAPGFSDCDGVVENGCETAGACTCPAKGPCEFHCENGCQVDCAGDCTVWCGPCTRCEITCRVGATCTRRCTESSAITFGNPFEDAIVSCELAATCPP
jgi:hypothetical protein